MAVNPLPPHAQLIVDFSNSIDHELGTDDLSTPTGLSSWFEAHGLRSGPAGEEDLALALRLRDGLHEALVGNHDGPPGSALLQEAAAELPLRLTAAGGPPGLAPVEHGVRGALASLLVAVSRAVADGTWQRLKICSSDECAWAYYDASKNRSRTWCEWGCGNRLKTRNYRARRRAAGTPLTG